VVVDEDVDVPELPNPAAYFGGKYWLIKKKILQYSHVKAKV